MTTQGQMANARNWIPLILITVSPSLFHCCPHLPVHFTSIHFTLASSRSIILIHCQISPTCNLQQLCCGFGLDAARGFFRSVILQPDLKQRRTLTNAFVGTVLIKND
jgi:hypothetical protein